MHLIQARIGAYHGSQRMHRKHKWQPAIMSESVLDPINVVAVGAGFGMRHFLFVYVRILYALNMRIPWSPAWRLTKYNIRELRARADAPSNIASMSFCRHIPVPCAFVAHAGRWGVQCVT